MLSQRQKNISLVLIFIFLIQFCSSGNNEPLSNSNVQTKENEITTSSTAIVKATNKVFSIQECLDWENNFDEIASQFNALMDPDYENKIGYIAGFTNGSDYLTEDVNYNIDVEPYIYIDSNGYVIELFDPFNNKYIQVHTYDRLDSFEQLSLDWGRNFLKEVQRYNAVVFPSVLPPPEEFKVSTLDYIETQKYYEKLISYTLFAATPIYDPENVRVPLFEYTNLQNDALTEALEVYSKLEILNNKLSNSSEKDCNSKNITNEKSNSNNSTISVCSNWTNNTASNLTSFQNYVNLMTDATYDAAYGYISYSEYQSKLENYEIRIKSIYSSQNSNFPNSSNQAAHEYFVEAIDLTLSAISFTIVGLELNDASYIELAADLQEESASSIRLATSNIRDC